MKLTDLKVRKLEAGPKAGRHRDGQGLYLEVTARGAKLWRMAYRFDGKQKTLSIGQPPFVTLARARENMSRQKRCSMTGLTRKSR